MDLQELIDAMSEAGRDARSDYHLTLGKLIRVLQEAPVDASVVIDTGGTPGDFDSYRGYYSDLAIEPSETPINVGQFLGEALAALGNTFMGYKGGDYLMAEKTALWVSSYGISSGQAVMGADFADGVVTLRTRQID